MTVVFLDLACPSDECPGVTTGGSTRRQRFTWSARAYTDHGNNVAFSDAKLYCPGCGMRGVAEDTVDLLMPEPQEDPHAT